MEYHPFAEPWPLMQGAPFDKLVADIKANGLLLPIITYQDKILDGRNRDRACAIAGVSPRYERSTATNDHDALVLSASLNEHRRHLSNAELAFVAARVSRFRGGLGVAETSDEVSSADKPILSEKEAATFTGAKLTSIQRAKAILRHAPELEAQVKAGRITLNAGAEMARDRGNTRTGPRNGAKKVQPPGRMIQKRDVPIRERNLTPKDVDPEFTGTPGDFTTEYGHVQVMTSLERSTSYFGDWAIIMGHLARELRRQQPPKVTPIVLSWLRSPKPADVERMRAAIVELDQALAKAHALLERAERTAHAPARLVPEPVEP